MPIQEHPVPSTRFCSRQHPQLNLEFWPAGWIFARLVSGIPEATGALRSGAPWEERV